MSLLLIVEFKMDIDVNISGLSLFLVIKGYTLKSSVELPKP